jgi:putative transposase
MMPLWLTMLFELLMEAWPTRRDAGIRFLKVQVEMLRARVPGNRIILPPEGRQRLLQLAVAIDHHVDDLIGIVSVKTLKRWLRERRAGKEPGRVGRPRKMTASVRALILRLARESSGWGIRRIVGELRKLARFPAAVRFSVLWSMRDSCRIRTGERQEA